MGVIAGRVGVVVVAVIMVVVMDAASGVMLVYHPNHPLNDDCA
jgi:hypothetical protein